MSDVPLVALGVARGQQGGGQQTNPFQILNDLATLEGHELDNKLKQNTMAARNEIGRVLATTSPDQVYGRVMAHPGIAYLPDIGNMMTAREKAAAEISSIQQTQGFNATDHNAKITAALALDPAPTRERYNQLVSATRAAVTDPKIRRMLDDNASVMADAYDLPTNDEWAAMTPQQQQERLGRVRNRIDGNVMATMGGWEGMLTGMRGGSYHTEGGVPYVVGTRGGVSTVPIGRPGAPGDPFDPRTPAPSAAAPANALAPPPTDAPPSYAPGAVSTEGVAPVPGTSVSPYASTDTGAPLGAPPAAPAPGGGPPGAPPPRTAAEDPNAEAPKTSPKGTAVWGPNASAHLKADDGALIALSDGKKLYPATGLRQPGLRPTTEGITGATHWGGQQPQVDAAATELSNLQKRLPDAYQALAQLTSVREALNEMQKRGGWYHPGITAEMRIDLMRRFNDLRDALGIEVPAADRKGEASFTALQKASTMLGFSAMSASLGQGREPLGVVNTSMSMVPGIANTFMSGQLVNRMIEARMQRAIDEEAFKRRWAADNNGNLIDATAAFNRAHPITQMEDKVLSEFGMGRQGFNGKQGIRDAYNAGYLSRQQAKDLLEGKPAGRE